MPQIMTCKQAIGHNLRKYFTGKPCKHGHVSERLVINGTCITCMNCKRDLRKNFYKKRHSEYIKARLKNDPEFRKMNSERAALWQKCKKLGIPYPGFRSKSIICKPLISEKVRARYIKHRPIRLSYYKRNKEILGQRAKEHHEKYPEKRQKIEKRFYDAHPEKRRMGNLKRRSLLAGVNGSYTENEIKELFKKQKEKCASCFYSITLAPRQKNTAHRDHVIPLADNKRSSNFITNIQLLCKKCNLRKGKKDALEFARQNGKLL